MAEEKLTQKKCVSCEGGVPPFTAEQIQEYLPQLKGEWEVVEGKTIRRVFERKDFADALSFINKIGEIAEAEGHHPDLRLFGYKNVEVQLSTHAVGGLSENDFIMAAKVEEVS